MGKKRKEKKRKEKENPNYFYKHDLDLKLYLLKPIISYQKFNFVNLHIKLNMNILQYPFP